MNVLVGEGRSSPLALEEGTIFLRALTLEGEKRLIPA